MISSAIPPTSLRVERYTLPRINDEIRLHTDARLSRLERAQPCELSSRLVELDHEWDIERVLQANASTLVVLGVLLGWTRDKRFLLLPAAVLTFFAQHALQGWCPPIPIFRRNGIRTPREIDRERFAVKALRGDFDEVPRPANADAQARVKAVLSAIDA